MARNEHIRTTGRFLRLHEVMDLTGMGKTTIYNWTNIGLFPPKHLIGKRASAWWGPDVFAWLSSKRINAEWHGSSADILTIDHDAS